MPTARENSSRVPLLQFRNSILSIHRTGKGTDVCSVTGSDFRERRVLRVAVTADGEVASPRSRRVRLVVKRIVDVIVSAAVLVVCIPVFAAIALYIAIRNGRPVLFAQTRVGTGGQHFTIHKFRTMTTDAEDQHHHLLHRNERHGPLFKVSNDPRVTKGGWFLRRSGLDELPQFVNVLRGEMSVVGPRPALPDEVERFPTELRRREVMRPGITGLWQIDGRTDSDFGKYTSLDLRYVDSWSLRMDLGIIARTPGVMLRHARVLHSVHNPREPIGTHPDPESLPDPASLDDAPPDRAPTDEVSGYTSRPA